MLSKAKNLLIILGPTSVGKSSTAVKMAHEFSGEIINCDSIQVYKGFNIGTDKISEERQENIPHHLLDIAEPSTQFTAAAFVKHTLKAADSILSKKRLPIITGGTGLYLKVLIEGLFPERKKDHDVRRRLEKEAETHGLKTLHQQLSQVDPAYGEKIGENDRVRIIRALEVYYATNKPISEHFSKTKSFVKNFNVIKVGLKIERAELYNKIENRVDSMFSRGIINEVQDLLLNGVSEDSPPFKALGYKQVLLYLKEKISLQEAIYLTKRDTRHYAKRQITWFRKMEGIKWFSPADISAIKKFIKSKLI